jgi:large subunit ribosomal protein L3
MKVLITRKVGMTSVITDSGELKAVTLLAASPNVITQIKTIESDGHNAMQIGFENAKKVGKSLAGHLKKSGKTPKVLKEFKLDAIDENITVGADLTAEVFKPGDMVNVSGVSKGKGFAGTIKRHNFHRGRKTHGGQSYRRPGSIGSMYPQKIFKGKKMAGHMGHENVTVRNLRVALIDIENQTIGVYGAIPGPRKGLIVLKGIE